MGAVERALDMLQCGSATFFVCGNLKSAGLDV